MILQEPNLKLHVKCKDAQWPNVKGIQKLLETEYQEYQDSHPHMHVVGLAAPQVDRPIRVFFAFGELFVNPEYVNIGPAIMTTKEGCCSTGRKVFNTERHRSIELRWFTKNRGIRSQWFDNMEAVIIQHEMDHLEGITLEDMK